LAANFEGNIQFLGGVPGIIGWYLEGVLSEDILLEMRMASGLSLQFVQSMDGARQIDRRRIRHFTGGNYYLSCFPDGASQHRHLRKNTPLRYVGIWVTPDLLASRYLAPETTQNKELDDFLDGHLKTTLDLNAPLSVRMQNCMDDLFASEFDGLLHQEFVKIKMSELICAALPLLISDRQLSDNNVRAARESIKIQRVAALLETRLAVPPNCRALAREVSIGHNRLAALFTNFYGCSIHQYSKRCRMKQAEILIRSGKHSMSDIAAWTGYNDQSSFSRAYRAYFGHKPSESRKKANT
tara:strand:- start:18388 stop:19278 length:891 start_codon:yes stop_codon:yes gene_type:complete